METLPCSKCVRNTGGNLEKIGIVVPKDEDGVAGLPSAEVLAQTPYFHSQKTLAFFFFALHNAVSEMLGKPTIPLEDFEKTMEVYASSRAKCSGGGAVSGSERGCVAPKLGYQPCMSRIVFTARPDPDPDSTTGSALFIAENLLV